MSAARCATAAGLWVTLVCGCDGPDLGTELKAGKLKVYYDDSASEADGQKLLKHLSGLGWNTEGNDKTVQLEKEGDKYIVKFVIDKGAEKKEAFRTFMQMLANQIAKEVFAGANVTVLLCDEQLDILHVVVAY